MDVNLNPFNPGAGVRPPVLAGRTDVLEQATVALASSKHGHLAKSLLLTGLRGVGKTVLLNEINKQAEQQDYLTAMFEAQENGNLRQTLILSIRPILLALDSSRQTDETVKRGLRVLRSFMDSTGSAGISIGIEPEAGQADSGVLETDVADLLLATGHAAQAAKRPVALLIDELQCLSQEEIAALICAFHAVNQAGLPFILFGAGLLQLAGLAGEAKICSEGMFSLQQLGNLSENDARIAIQQPIEDAGAYFHDDAIAQIVAITRGYPYFLQEWGYHAWNLCGDDTVKAYDVTRATEAAIKQLDKSFFRVRLDRLIPEERDYLRALADLGAEPQTTADIAKALERKPASSTKSLELKPGRITSVRESLVKKGMIYSPAPEMTAFTTPLFDEFMRRILPSREDWLKQNHPGVTNLPMWRCPASLWG
jgi:hypothetical protein